MSVIIKISFSDPQEVRPILDALEPVLPDHKPKKGRTDRRFHQVILRPKKTPNPHK
ncbi:MAG: hypothetical protein VB081_12540 [Christensenella sp.]|uniref:hypothetical protein n=1 Tax=Clostridia TaxID=186801 RepID=UPI0015A2605A|nr:MULTISPECIES: hypothetical protein [Clostridia]MEA5004307.1 hypothetical protein [Christensenella sp.]